MGILKCKVIFPKSFGQWVTAQYLTPKWTDSGMCRNYRLVNMFNQQTVNIYEPYDPSQTLLFHLLIMLLGMYNLDCSLFLTEMAQ